MIAVIVCFERKFVNFPSSCTLAIDTLTTWISFLVSILRSKLIFLGSTAMMGLGNRCVVYDIVVGRDSVRTVCVVSARSNAP
jgi:hypothetical protein